MAKRTRKKRRKHTIVRVEVNVTQIVKYVCIAGVLIVAIIFGSRTAKGLCPMLGPESGLD